MIARIAWVLLAAPMLASAGPAKPPPPIVVYDLGPQPRRSPPKDLFYPFPSDGRIRIFFEFGSAAITPIPEEILDNASAGWTLCPDSPVTIAGHSDSGESGPGSIELSLRRAESARAGLIARGGNPARISVEAYGSSRPAAAVAQGARQPVNRRVDITIPCLLRRGI